MRNLLYVIAVILIIGWLLGYLNYHIGGNFIHILLVLAIIMVIIRQLPGRKTIH